MHTILLVPKYLGWHYTRAIKELFNNLINLIHFVGEFFSFIALFKTFFSPWRRIHESYGKGLDPEAFLTAFVVNSLMRLVGVVARLFILVGGLVSLVVSVVIGITVFVGWLLLPFLIAFLLALGIISLAS